MCLLCTSTRCTCIADSPCPSGLLRSEEWVLRFTCEERKGENPSTLELMTERQTLVQNTRFAAPIPGVGTSGRRAEKSLVNTNVPVYSGFTCRLDWDCKTHIIRIS